MIQASRSRCQTSENAAVCVAADETRQFKPFTLCTGRDESVDELRFR